MRLRYAALKEWGRAARKEEGKTKRARDKHLHFKEEFENDVQPGDLSLWACDSESSGNPDDCRCVPAGEE